MQNNNSSEDFDLFSLLLNLKKKIYKWRILIIAAVFLGISTGLVAYFTSPKIYRSRMAVTSNLLRGPDFVIVIDALQGQLKEGNIEALKKLLNIDETTLKKVNGLKVFSSRTFVERQLNTAIATDQNKEEETNFVIEAYVENNDILPQLEEGMLYYFKNNYYMLDKGTRLKKELNDELNKIDQELRSLDTIKRSLNEVYSMGSSSKISSMYINDPGKIAEDIVTLYKLKMETEDRLIMTDVKIVEKFMPYKKPYSPKPFFTVISWLFIFVITSIIIIALVEFNEKLKEKEHTQ